MEKDDAQTKDFLQDFCWHRLYAYFYRHTGKTFYKVIEVIRASRNYQMMKKTHNTQAMVPNKLARGTWKLIEDGIAAYMQERGCKPAALILHPRHAKTLFREIPADATLLDDVSVLISPRFALPVLADQKGNPVEL